MTPVRLSDVYNINVTTYSLKIISGACGDALIDHVASSRSKQLVILFFGHYLFPTLDKDRDIHLALVSLKSRCIA